MVKLGCWSPVVRCNVCANVGKRAVAACALYFGPFETERPAGPPKDMHGAI